MKIKYQCLENTIISIDGPRTILDVSTMNRIPHLHECGGRGMCTTCRVRILEGIENLSEPSQAEKRQLKNRNWDDYTRLACQTVVKGDVTIRRSLKTSAEVSQLQLESLPEGMGKEMNLAILFCDLRNFTQLVESSLAFDVVHIMNRLFGVLGDSILLNSGVIYQYVGDEIVGLFGLGSEDSKGFCTNAIRAGSGMLGVLERLNQDLEVQFDKKLSIGVGIHFGTVIAGRIGHPTDRRFAVLGDAVNVASRIQGMNKELGTELLISYDIFEKIDKDLLKIGLRREMLLKGKSDKIQILEVKGFSEPDMRLIVQSTWEEMKQKEYKFGELLYAKLFEIAPHLTKMFSGDMASQSRMLAQMLDTIIYSTSRPEHLTLGLFTLGKKHDDYGVKDEHYELIKKALMNTLQDVLNDQFDDNTQLAWSSIIDLIISTMKKGAKR